MIDHRIGKIKVRRGTDSQRKLVTFEEGELVYSIDKQRLYIGNSKEKGGILVSNINYVKNSVGDPPVAPSEAAHGDIVYDKSNSRTYITKCDTSSCELILIADAGCCARLQIEIDDLYRRLRTLMPCATTTPPPPPPPARLTWYIEPSDISVNLGETVTFTASAIVGLGVINYKWNRKDGIPISVIDNQPTLTFTTQTTDEATYYCIANTLFSQSITSKDAVLTIGSNSILAEDGTYVLSELDEFIDWEVSGLLAPTIITHPRSQVTTALVPVTFSVVAAGSSPLSYQWRLNGVDIVGETGTTYTITNPTKDLTGITCYVSNSIGNVESNPASLSVGIKPTIVTQPVSQTVNTGSSVTFSVVAAGTNPLRYQWSKDGVVINGATSSTYTINTSQTSDQGNYSCLVSNNYGNITSNLVPLQVNDIFDAGDIIISADTNNFVLKDSVIAKGWNLKSILKVNVIVNSGVTVGSNSSTLPSFTIDNFPLNSVINLTNNGIIQGAGGDGGIAGVGASDYGTNGKNGGDSLKVLNSVNITNNGSIWSGGGGGGGARGINGETTPNGGGGAGTIVGTPDGTKTLGGIGKTFNVSMMGVSILKFKGGDGGNPGQNGKSSEFAPDGLNTIGGLAGHYIVGNSFVTWIKKGDVLGNVK
jgi:hypothetical protein